MTGLVSDMTGSSDNGYGFSQPAYFAYDDVAVRIEKATSVDGVNAQTVELDVYYDLQGRRVENPTRGVYIHNGKKVFFK